MTFDEAINAKAAEVAKLVLGKQRDYGKKNILNSVIDPKLAIAVRLQDKIARLANLSQSNSAIMNESLLDTANDIIGYGLVLAMVIEGTFELEMADAN